MAAALFVTAVWRASPVGRLGLRQVRTHAGPESCFCLYPGLTSWAIVMSPLSGLIFRGVEVRSAPWVL